MASKVLNNNHSNKIYPVKVISNEKRNCISVTIRFHFKKLYIITIVGSAN